MMSSFGLSATAGLSAACSATDLAAFGLAGLAVSAVGGSGGLADFCSSALRSSVLCSSALSVAAGAEGDGVAAAG
jgi:hypothetical protein